MTSIEENNISYCLGCVHNESDIPYGTTCLGVYCLKADISEEELIDLCLKFNKNKKSGKLLILSFDYEKDLSQLKTNFLDIKSKQFCECSLEFVEDNEPIDKTLIVRLKVAINLTFKSSKDELLFSNNLNESMTKLKEDSNSLNLKLIQSTFKTQISDNNKSLNSITLSDLYGYLEEDEDMFDGIEVPANMKKKMVEKMRKKKAAERAPLEFVSDNYSDKNCELSELEIPEENKDINMTLLVDVLTLIQEMNSISYLNKIFSTIMRHKIDAFEKAILRFTDFSSMKISVPKIYNFWSQSICAHFISVIYPINIDDESLITTRKEIHLKYLVPMDRPNFRKGNRYLLDNEKSNYGYLTNVHIGLNNSGLKNGQIFTVYGTYSYHHYMQDRIDDSGWGCAYRSLQTVVSWFRHQAYIDKPIPTHKEIQQALVDVGDKNSSFVGSNQWIGSQEVSFVLNHLYGIISKIMFVSSGAELANKGRELAHHFTTNGTPIMIGGGVLAHTIIGVDFNQDTGEVKFLVLDPHYTGAEDLALIQKKVSFFSLNIHFYTFITNLL
jgi:hypothetical protein